MTAAVFRQWVVSVGRRHAAVCMMDVLCELLVRLRAVELVENHAFELALTQGDLAYALGISNVHVNRVLQISGTRSLPARENPEGTGLGGA
jgi:hypothetical protein